MSLFKSASTGMFVTFIFILLTSFISAIILKLTAMPEIRLTTALVCTAGLSIFIGGLVAGSKNGQNGWLVGALTAIMYTCSVVLIQLFLFQTILSVSQLVLHSIFFLLAALGGMIGVNIGSGTKQA
ncbi:TIGR04086 family membrane protein [Paenalkalicoccus suaedae]|uniref:TIGR04086 family membrane protein n=1 Tax=Paenalkalicoccus suaedae TaxID=2592382 RepID=A0A859FD79_9BACI|nr:TIGR04086 family membrane protein [Paenalkalicoccus suaedae]QKS70771.1 TIGR04086 family membrane protein [Paenalkalicoccus suaedae]